MTDLTKTWTLPTGQVLTVVPHRSDHYGNRPAKAVHVASGDRNDSLSRVVAQVNIDHAVAERRAAVAEQMKASKGKRPPKPKRPEALVAPEGVTLYRDSRTMSPVSTVTSVSDTGASKQVYHTLPKTSTVFQETLSKFLLFTPEQFEEYQAADQRADAAEDVLEAYEDGYDLSFIVNDDADLEAHYTFRKETRRRVYPMGFLTGMDSGDPEVVVLVGGQPIRVDTSYGVDSYTQEFHNAVAADLGLVRIYNDRACRTGYDYIGTNAVEPWNVLNEAVAEARSERTRLYREAVGRAGVLLLGYEESFVAWKADVADWEREWKS